MNAVLVSRRITAARLPVDSGAIVSQALPGG